MKRKGIFASLLKRSMVCLCSFIMYSAIGQEAKKSSNDNQIIHIHHANFLAFDKRFGDGAQRLIGNVEMEHAGMLLNCDSAYVYNSNTSARAFGHVHAMKKDSMDLY